MKAITKKAVFVFSFLTVFSVSMQAKPDYCQTALRNCWAECENTIFVGACQTGCNIGYLFCG
jgi:hypothetical protein